MCVEMWINLFSRFRDDERGVATVESLLWMPIFFYLFILITDVSFIFYGKAQALRIVQDGNRAYSVDGFPTNAAASAYIQGQLRQFAPTATATTTTSGGIISTTATVPANDLMAVGAIPQFVGLVVNITAQQYQEN
jgi:Flp pilus assembly protein TadG